MSKYTDRYIRKEMALKFIDIPHKVKGLGELPKDTILHYLVEDGTLGPRSDTPIIKELLDTNDDIYLHNILEIPKDLLHGRVAIRSNISRADKEFFIKYRIFSKVHNLDRVLSRANAPIVYNYNHIFHNYKTNTNKAIERLYRSLGNFSLLWSTIADVDSDSLQLVPIKLPRLLTDLTKIKALIKKPNVTNLLAHLELSEVYIFSLATIITSEEYSHDLVKRNIVFRVVDGINHVDIPYRLIATEIDRKGSSLEYRLNTLYDIFDSLITLRVGTVDTEADDVELDSVVIKDSSIKVDNTPTELLDAQSNIEKAASKLKDRGVISEGAIARAKKDSVKYKSIKIDGVTVEDILKESASNKRELPKSTIPELKLPIGDSLKSNTVVEMDKVYSEKVLEQDFIENLLTLSKDGHMVLNITKENVRDAGTDDTLYSVQTRHINGDVGTLKISIPKVKADGTFKSGGVIYRMGKQRMTLPIVKIGPNEVAMTSSRSKIFVHTDRLASNSLKGKFDKLINKLIIDEKITKYTPGIALEPDTKYGYIEGSLAESFGTLEYNSLKLDFKKGHTYKKEPIKISKTGDMIGKENYGSVLSVFDTDLSSLAEPFSEAKIKGAEVPISCILGSWMGLSEFLKYTGIKTKEYDVGQRVDSKKGPVVRFKDVKVQFNYTNMEQLLLINGLVKYDKFFREINRDALDTYAGFSELFLLMGLGRSQIRGIASIENRWIDSITSKLLIRQEYPTDMINLFISVNKLLSDKTFNRESDGDMMFIRGYDRINDIVYKEISAAIDTFDSNNSNKRKLTINPRAVKMAILSDGLVSPSEDTSPINLISNQTRIGYSGTGGRSDRSMVARHRVFDPNDLGVISDAGTDDGKAGTVLNTPMNPNFDSIYGTSSKKKDLEVGNVLCASSLNAPFTLHDEMKRTVFARIQGNSMIYSEGYRIMPVYTGAGLVISHQVNGNYTQVASDKGVVLKVTDHFVEVKYDNGEKIKLKIGRGYSKNSGKVLPKVLITDVKKGDKFRKGAVLIWDKNYFARSMIDRDQVDVYNGSPLFLAIKEDGDTYEDGSADDQDIVGKSLSSNIVHLRPISVKFNENFKLTAKVGDHVSPNTPLGVITPEGVPITDDNKDLDFMSRVTPKARYSGTIVRIETNYIGNKKDASKGILKEINASDKMFKEEAEYSDVFPSGEIKEPTYINQEYLDKNSAIVTVYIEHMDVFSVGDKSSACNALKTVNGYAWSGKVETLSGIPISGKFSGDGIFRRITPSAFAIGLLNFCQYSAGVRVSDVYHGRSKL